MSHEAMRALLQRPIAFHPAFVDLMGSISGGLFLSQLLYWASRKDGGWFYKTDTEIREETRLTKRELQRAKTVVKGLAFVEVHRKGVPARTWYRVDLDGLVGALAAEEAGTSSLNDGVQTGWNDGVQTGRPDGVQTTPRDYTETTTESTQARPPSRNPAPDRPPDVSPGVWQEYLQHRRQQKAPLTKTAWKRMEPELQQLRDEGWAADDVLGEVMAAGWRAFKADWIRNRVRRRPDDGSEHKRAFARAL